MPGIELKTVACLSVMIKAVLHRKSLNKNGITNEF
jgi:hypothetical protein